MGRGRAGRGPNPKSTPKEIAGSHGHRSHGKSILWPALYEHLIAKGHTKQKAAMISNGLWRKKRGLPPKSVPGTKGKVKVAKMSPDSRSVHVPRAIGTVDLSGCSHKGKNAAHRLKKKRKKKKRR